jgi:hypothetical protein
MLVVLTGCTSPNVWLLPAVHMSPAFSDDRPIPMVTLLTCCLSDDRTHHAKTWHGHPVSVHATPTYLHTVTECTAVLTWLTPKLSLITSRKHLEPHFYYWTHPLILDLTLPSVQFFSCCVPSSKPLRQRTSAAFRLSPWASDHSPLPVSDHKPRAMMPLHHWPNTQVQRLALHLVSSSELPDFTNFATLDQMC